MARKKGDWNTTKKKTNNIYRGSDINYNFQEYRVQGTRTMYIDMVKFGIWKPSDQP